MKRIRILIACVFALFIGAGIFFACQKNSSELLVNELERVEIQKAKPGEVNVIIFKVTLRREIDERPRDKKPCGCRECFGLCDFVWFPAFKESIAEAFKTDEHQAPVLIEFDTARNQATLYILEKKDYFESEFGIDSSLDIPEKALENTNFTSVTIKDGLYTFYPNESKVKYDGTDLISYGTVVVDLSIVNKSIK